MWTGMAAPSYMPVIPNSPAGLQETATVSVAASGAEGAMTIDPNTPGLALIPPKLVQRILKGEFIDMYELLPETWRMEEAQDSCCRSSRPKRGLVTDISLWTECYASLVAVLTTKYPEKAPQFMGYLRTIVRASRNFEGTAWASYDAAYRRQAANRKSFDWAAIDPTIYNEAFTGRAKLLPRCRYCLADTHEARECQYAPRDEPPPPKMPRWAGWGPPTRSGGLGDRAWAGRGVEIGDLFNRPEGNKCSFKWCRYAHLCSRCRRGPHPAAECPRGAGPKESLHPPRDPGRKEERGAAGGPRH